LKGGPPLLHRIDCKIPSLDEACSWLGRFSSGGHRLLPGAAAWSDVIAAVRRIGRLRGPSTAVLTAPLHSPRASLLPNCRKVDTQCLGIDTSGGLGNHALVFLDNRPVES